MAIDYGQKRTGIAVTDELQMIANGLTTVESRNIFVFLTDYIAKEKVDSIVVGEPKQMNNMPSESVKFVDPFVKKLKKLFPSIPVFRLDERFTSKMAFQTMIDAGLKKKARPNKALVDTLSAAILLQSYLETSR
jgi:putative holliday junction resolvase